MARTFRGGPRTKIRQPRTRQHPHKRVAVQQSRSVKRGPRVGHTGASHAMTSGKQGMMRPGNQFRSGGLRNPRAGGSSQGGRRNRHLVRDVVLGSPKVRQKQSPQQRAWANLGKHIKKSPARHIGRADRLPKIPKSAKVAQQQLSNEYDITTYNLDGTISTTPDYGEGEIR